jgi:hypothetical protein
VEIGISELGSLFEQVHGDEEISVRKKRATEPRHSTRIGEAERDGQIRAADLKSGGPRYSLPPAGFDRESILNGR